MNREKAIQIIKQSYGWNLCNDSLLQDLVEAISLLYFEEPFSHNAFFNSRLKTTGGRYHLKTHHLDFNPKVFEKFGIEELIAVVKHELCHYHLHIQGRGYQHKDKEFKGLLAKTGGTRYVKSLQSGKDLHHYYCIKCHTKISRKRRINTTKYICGKCHGKLQLLKKG